jgi:hypothetical protein
MQTIFNRRQRLFHLKEMLDSLGVPLSPTSF